MNPVQQDPIIEGRDHIVMDVERAMTALILELPTVIWDDVNAKVRRLIIAYEQMRDQRNQYQAEIAEIAEQAQGD